MDYMLQVADIGLLGFLAKEGGHYVTSLSICISPRETSRFASTVCACGKDATSAALDSEHSYLDLARLAWDQSPCSRVEASEGVIRRNGQSSRP